MFCNVTYVVEHLYGASLSISCLRIVANIGNFTANFTATVLWQARQGKLDKLALFLNESAVIQNHEFISGSFIECIANPQKPKFLKLKFHQIHEICFLSEKKLFTSHEDPLTDRCRHSLYFLFLDFPCESVSCHHQIILTSFSILCFAQEIIENLLISCFKHQKVINMMTVFEIEHCTV